MPHDHIDALLDAELVTLARDGRRKAAETVVTEIVPPAGKLGPRYRVAGDETNFLRMNANSYLGLSRHREVIAAAHEAGDRFGAGPGAVRFIAGTATPHIALEARLARFHGHDAALIFSSAYATMLGVLAQIISADTAVISDALNHNCIINGVRLARPRERHVYAHLDLAELEARLGAAALAQCRRAIVITDGIFSMRGDHAPLDKIAEIIRRHDANFAENILLVVDDSHGVGTFGATGRGTEEVTGARADILVGTLGKAFGVNGGYVAASRAIIAYLRETAPTYVYSNPISPAEAAAAAKAVDIVDSRAGAALINHLRQMTARFRDGLRNLGFETLAGEHPIVPLLTRDTALTAALIGHLRRNGVLATGLAYPVLPRGEEEIRFQICAEHTAADIDQCLEVLRKFERQPP